MEKKQNKKLKGGRKKLPEKEKRKHYDLFLNEEEFVKIDEMRRQLGHKYFGKFIRYLLLKRSDNFVIADSVEVLERLDRIGGELNKIGSNFNQLAKYANHFAMISKYDKNLIEEFNKNFEEYKKLKLQIIKSYDRLVRSF